MKQILSAITAAAIIFSFAACSKIEPPTAETTVTDLPQETTTVLPTTEATVTTEPEEVWSYSFGNEFIAENGLEYIWQRLDENTKINLGEAMNAVRGAVVYCPLTVGFPKEETADFLELLFNCTIAYTYDSNQIKAHIDQSGTVKGLTIYYTVDYEYQAREQHEALEAVISGIIENMPNGAENDKLRYLHDYLVKNCRYGDISQNAFNAYGALIEGFATCQGYADAMHLLLTRAGYNAVFATGEVDGAVKHKWNYVKLSNGKWYAIDTTWDDPENQEDPNYVGYDYFLISDRFLLKNHKKYESTYYSLPESDSMSLNFYKRMDWYAETEEQAYEILKAQALEAAKTGNRYLYIRFKSVSLMDSAYEYICSGTQDVNKMVEIITEMNAVGEVAYSTNQWAKSRNENTFTLTITLNYAN